MKKRVGMAAWAFHALSVAHRLKFVWLYVASWTMHKSSRLFVCIMHLPSQGCLRRNTREGYLPFVPPEPSALTFQGTWKSHVFTKEEQEKQIYKSPLALGRTRVNMSEHEWYILSSSLCHLYMWSLAQYRPLYTDVPVMTCSLARSMLSKRSCYDMLPTGKDIRNMPWWKEKTMQR